VCPKTTLGQKPQSTEEIFTQSLLGIASILLRLGLNAPQGERYLRRAFVHAALSNAGTNSSRATQSKIASLAGISRLEVRRILGHRSSKTSTRERHANRVDQILIAWRNDPRFLDLKGRPRPLSFKGSHSLFAKLVRQYGRDVTIKTLRDQLMSSGAALEQKGCMVISKRSKQHSDHAIAARADLRFLESQFRNIDLRMGKRAYVTKRVSVWVNDKKSVRRLQREAQEKIDLMLAALSALSLPRDAIARGAPKSRHRVLVVTTIATESGEKTNA
jgi:Family of unknown function (DUF6502)